MPITEGFPQFTPKQLKALEAARTHKYTLYGGGGGSGKSMWLRWWNVFYLISLFRNFGLKNVGVGLFCEDYPALENRQIQKIKAEFPSWLGVWNASRRTFTLTEKWGSGIITCLNLDDPSKYRSAEFAAIAIDELTMNKREIFDNLSWRIRWPGVDKPKFVAATNPTGPGHLWVKKLWVDRNFKDESEALKSEDFAYVQALPTDNPHLPATYFTETLASLPEFMRKALLHGSWDVIEGQYFSQWREDIHVKPQRQFVEGVTDKWGIPTSWQRVGGIDWGRAKPWAAVEAAIDEDGRLIVYRGVAEAGWEHQQQAEWLMSGAPGVTWFADDACWSKGAANSTEARAMDVSHYELWVKYGASNIMKAKKGDRIPRWQHMAGFLKCMPNDSKRAWIEFVDVPGLRGDHGPIVTIPKLIHDKNCPEDIDTTIDDHAGDCVSYLLLSRPSPTITIDEKKRPYVAGDYFADKVEVEQPEYEFPDDDDSRLDSGSPIASRW